MTEETNQFKERLLAEKNRIEAELRKIADKDSEGDYEAKFQDLGREREDNASEVENYTVNLDLTDSMEKELDKIDLSLKKIENGTYGQCENCHKEISPKRLEVYPAAQNCMDCK
jgi:RNA polymerase-binding protein DksA